jgi:osmotically-inducible protein OsmY
MSHPKRPDMTILSDVRDELAWDTRLASEQVTAEVSGGVVTLTGTVGSWTARLAALEAAQRVDGVLDVVTDIFVVPRAADSRQDTEIAKAVRHALEWHVHVPNERIRTTVSDGVITLEGEVDYWSQFDDASRCVRDLIGVREVRNLIVVRPSKVTPSVDELKAHIEQALARHAFHSAAHVEVHVERDKVTLRGEVPSWPEMQAIQGAVRGTPGVVKVESHLHIR